MADDLDSFDVQKIQQSAFVDKSDHPRDDRQRKEHQHQQPFKEAKDYLHTIAKAAEVSNAKLAAAHVPYRFCIYEENNEIFINVVCLDKNGTVVKTQKTNISHKDFERLIEDVSLIEGLFVDKIA